MLGGGFPRGSLVELFGPASSGRTSLVFSLLAQATERQEACAFVDVSDSLDPISLAAAGVELPAAALNSMRRNPETEEARISKRLHTLRPADKEVKKNSRSQIPRIRTQCQYMVGGIREN